MGPRRVIDEQSEAAPSPSTPRSRRQLAERLFAVVRRLRSRSAELAGDFGLSVLQVRALWRLEDPLPTGELAERLGLDPSNITGVVDRLESLGLVTRKSQPEDRRVKLLTLTEAGRRVRSHLDERLFATFTLFDCLSDDEQQALEALLTKVLVAADPPLQTVGPAPRRAGTTHLAAGSGS
jgi:DNA-binding MarR family transcriptional regulator